MLTKAGCVLKLHLAAGKIALVFAILTNGETFQFAVIDTDGTVHLSSKQILQPGQDGSYKSIPSLIGICSLGHLVHGLLYLSDTFPGQFSCTDQKLLWLKKSEWFWKMIKKT